MKLNHLGVTVSDVMETRAFLEKYFGMRGIDGTSHNMTHLQDDDGLILSLFRGTEITSPQTTHIGFMQATEAQVDELYGRLKADGFEVRPSRHSHGYTFYVTAPGGLMVEVVC